MTTTKEGQNKVPEVSVPVTPAEEDGSTVVAAGKASAGVSGPLGRRRSDLMQGTLRLLCLVTSLTAVGFMVSARQSGSVSIYGFMLPVNSKWSFSHSFQYLVGVTAVCAAHSLLQLAISSTRLIKNTPIVQSRTHAWLLFAVDQALAYAVVSGGAASAGVSNLNKTGIRHTVLPNFCKPLQSFCDHVAVSIGFAFFTFCLLAASAVQQVVWLSNNPPKNY
ncbi:unnamed protein product [Linum trigynum]|uniref:CASP-like protein n=1 Tax=Linum trigynum TaxID=586398 RepID=A0AAV2DXE1_9ROSI